MQERFFGQTYILTEELKKITPLLREAMDFQRMQYPGYGYPYSYWADNHGWLYIKWEKKDEPNIYTVWRYSKRDGILIAEKIKHNLSKMERLRDGNPLAPAITITGDTHGKFERIFSFTRKYGTVPGDMMIILGDAGINYYGGYSDDRTKYLLSKTGIDLFCIHGNHEMRPESTGLYKEKEWHGGIVYVEDSYPSLMFAKDGDIYDIGGYKTLVIGGAYSVDKYYRLENGLRWFGDEQPSEETKAYVEQQLEKSNWKVDVVLSHTVPYKYRPVDLFMDGIDQSTVDNSTEKWLGEIENRLQYKKWYAGHYHCDRECDSLTIMYKKVSRFMNDTDLKFERE